MYQAIISRIINVMPITNTDNISFGTVNGNTVVVSRATTNGELGIFFECDGALSPEFAKTNDLTRYKDPITGESKGGFFDDNGRVRAQKFRGVKSDGFWCPLSYLGFTGVDISSLKEHDKFDTLNGVVICFKYITEATKKASNRTANVRKKLRIRKEIIAFPKHFDTKQFRNEAWQFKKGDLISISEKLHGTSQRFAYVEESHICQKYSWPWLLQKLGLKQKKVWKHVLGTRNIVLESPETSKGYYENEAFRFKAVQPLVDKLHKYEMIFAEIVGWSGQDTSIMPAGNPKAMNDKKFQKTYGTLMNYSYGCERGNVDMFIYRIIRMNEDGKFVDLSWDSVKKRCAELGVKTVPELCDSFIYDGNEETLRELVESLTDGVSVVDSRHIREGVCVRAENYPAPTVMKSKSFAFKCMEGMQKDKEDYVDIEEAS